MTTRHPAHFGSAIMTLAAALAGCAPLAAEPPAQSIQQCQPSNSAQSPDRQPLRVEQLIPADDGVRVVRFDNGLTAIVKPNRSAAVVTVRAYVRTGSLYEGKWLGAGISHLTEHLVAEGAEHHMGEATAPEAAKASGRARQIGGQSNAATSLDYTLYYISATAGKTDDCIDLVADWLARPGITKADFEREHGVVQRELEMGQNEAGRQLWHAHMANAYGTHPAAVPMIGYKAPLAHLTYDDVIAYHRMTYVPQNMAVVVVGDVDAQSVLDRMAQAFAGFGAGRASDLTLPQVQPLAGVRRVIRPSSTVKEAVQDISFVTIPLVHEDLYALDVLSYILAEGRAARLVQTIQRQLKLVTSISSSSWTPDWGKGLFTISFRAEQDKADAAEQAILDELRSVVDKGVTPQELARAKRQKVADYVYSLQTVESQAATLGMDYLSTGDVNFSRNYTDRIQAVTGEQVHAAARKYLDLQAMAITRLVPQAPQAAPPATAPARAPTEASIIVLPNGLRVVLRPVADAGLVSMAFVTEGGVLAETEQTNGLGTLMTELSTKGAGGMTAEQIDAFFDYAGGKLEANCGNNTFYWQATVLEDSFEKALEILADVVQRPAFDSQELETIRPVAIDAITRQDEGVMPQLIKLFRRSFYSDGSPYRLMPAGAKDVVAKATAKQIADYHRKHVKAGSSVLAVYGQFDASKASKRVGELFADVPPGKADLKTPQQASSGGDRLVVCKSDHTVAGVVVAVGGMKVTETDDRFPMDVLDTIISGWNLPSGWLHEELRGKQLVYVVHAQNWVGLAPGAFFVYAQCQPQEVAQVLQIIERNLRKAAGYTPTPQEVEQAANTILTAELLENQSVSALALSAAIDELYGLGYDFRTKLERRYRSVTPQDVHRVAEKYLSRPMMRVVTTPQVELAPGAGGEGSGPSVRPGAETP